MSILSCKDASLYIKDKVKKELEQLKYLERKPSLAVISITDNESSKSYSNGRKIDCKYCGIDYYEYKLESDINQISLLNLIYSLNEDDDVSGILLDMPIPNHLDKDFIISKISPFKDVDAINQNNLLPLLYNQKTFFNPCTALGVLKLLDYYNIDVIGKHCVVLGRSLTVGKPLALMFLNKDASVTVCHSKSLDISNITKTADIIVSCVGKAEFLKADMIKQDSIIIDVGINYLNGQICGDVEFSSVSEKAKFITTVPNGIGLMTRACLMKNVLKAFKTLNNIDN